MKILTNEDYRQIQVKEKCLVDSIDRALMLLGNIDRSKFSCDEIGVEENFYFWSAIGTLKGALYDYEPKYKSEWIEP